MVVMKTSMGDIKIELDQAKAPVSTANFLAYANDKFYDGTIFHRVIPAFMIQGGGFDKDMNQKKTKAPIKNEAGNGLKNVTGTIAMARTSDPNSATAQFFINTKDNVVPRSPRRQRAGLRLRGVRQGGRRHGRREEDRGRADDHQDAVPERAGDAGGHRERGPREEVSTATPDAGVIFDLDGVIIDSEALQHRAYNQVLQRFGIQVDAAVYGREWIAAGRGPEYAVRELGLPISADRAAAAEGSRLPRR